MRHSCVRQRREVDDASNATYKPHALQLALLEALSQDVHDSRFVRHTKVNDTVKPPSTKNGRVELANVVGGSDHEHSFPAPHGCEEERATPGSTPGFTYFVFKPSISHSS